MSIFPSCKASGDAHSLVTECREIPPADIVSSLSQLNDPFADVAIVAGLDSPTSIPHQPILAMDISDQCHTQYHQRTLTDLVSSLPILEDLFEEDSALTGTDRTDRSTSVPAQQSLLSDMGMGKRLRDQGCERPSADTVSDLQTLDVPFDQDAHPAEVDISPYTSSQPIPCPSMKDDHLSHRDDNEACFSYDSGSEGSS